MAGFDPYHKWLGIPADEQPADHYRLLGLKVFESDPEVIEAAADRQMTYVRGCATGPHVATSQQVLNELSAARICLLNQAKKQAYDKELRARRGASNKAVREPPRPIADIAINPPARKSLAATPPWQRPAVLASAGVGLLALLVVAVVLGFRGGNGSQPASTATADNSQLAKRRITKSTSAVDTVAAPPADPAAKPSAKSPPASQAQESQSGDLAAAKPSAQPSKFAGKSLMATATTQGYRRVCMLLAGKGAPAEAAEDTIPFTAPPGNGRKGANGLLIPAASDWRTIGTDWVFEYQRSASATGIQIIHPFQEGHILVQLHPEVKIIAGGSWAEIGWIPRASEVAVTKGAGYDSIIPIQDDVPRMVYSMLKADGSYRLDIHGQQVATAKITAARPLSLNLPDGARPPGGSSWDKTGFVGSGLPRTLAPGEAGLIIGPLDRGTNRAALVQLRPLYGAPSSEPGRAAFVVDWMKPSPLKGSTVWSGFPEILKDAVIYDQPDEKMPKTIPGNRISLTVKQPGALLVATSWDYDGNDSGGWTEGRTKEPEMATLGWERIGTLKRTRKDEINTYTIFRKQVKAGDRIQFHSRKYNPPLAIAIKPEDGGSSLAQVQLGAPPPAKTAEAPSAVASAAAPAASPGSAAPAAATPETKLPVPEGDALQKAEQAIRQLYKDDIAAAKKPDDQAKLAKKLLELAVAAQDNAATRYALLSQARDLAVKAGNAATAVEAIDEIGRWHTIDLLAEKRETLLKAAQATKGTTANGELSELTLGVVEEAIAADDYDTATRLITVAATAASKAKDRLVTGTVAEIRKQLPQARKDYDAAAPFAEKLKADPDDAEANLQWGSYLCFKKGDWPAGLPLLAKGKDAKLKAAALLDLANPAEPAELVKLADEWWDAATGRDKNALPLLQARAVRWYQAALPALAGLPRAKVEQRLKDAAKHAAGSNASAAKPFGYTLVIWNTHNGAFRDCGTLLCNVSLYNSTDSLKPFFKAVDVKVPWNMDREVFVTVYVPQRGRTNVLRKLRIEITQCNGTVAGLAEVEVLYYNKNVALGSRAVTDGNYNQETPSEHLTDGSRDETATNIKYWLSNKKTCSVELYLEEKAAPQ